MSKVMTRLVVGAFVAALGVTALGTTESSAQSTCGSPDECGRIMACSPGWNMQVLADGYVCARNEPQDDPICGARNLRNDWAWSAQQKMCCRGSGDNRNCSTENIECPLNTGRYNPQTGKCELPAYARVVATTSRIYGDGTPTRCYPAACPLVMKCPAGYALKPSAAQGFHHCAYEGERVSVSPTCNGAQWRWNATAKQCCAGSTCQTTNIVCPEGTAYMAFKGKCDTSAPRYVAPTMGTK